MRRLTAWVHILLLCLFLSPLKVSAQGIAEAACTNTGGPSGDGALIQSLVNTGQNVHISGNCVGDVSIYINTPGQRIYGDGLNRTVITVSTVLSNGLFVTGPLAQAAGPRIEDLGVTFVQNPNASARSQLVPYTPAFSFHNTIRFQLHRVRIVAPMIGVDMRGNAGGAILDDVEVSPLSVGVWIDGSADSVRVDNYHAWVYGPAGQSQLSPSLTAIQSTPNLACNPETTTGSDGAIGIFVGAASDLKIRDPLFLVGQAVCFEAGTFTTATNSFTEITGTDFDTYGGIVLNQPPSEIVNISASFFCVISNQYTSLYVSQGSLNCSSCYFFDLSSGSVSPVLIYGTSVAPPEVSISGSSFVQGGGDLPSISLVNFGSLVVSGSFFDRFPNINYTQPIVAVGPGTKATIVGNRVSPIGSGSGAFVQFGSDDFNVVVGNAAPGWAMHFPISLPTSPGIYACNSNGAQGLGCSATGTWTPAISIGGSVSGIQYTNQTGYWKTDANTVTLELIYVQLSSKGGLSGPVEMTGLPFAAATGVGGSLTVGTGENLQSMGSGITGNVTADSSSVLLTQMNSTGNVLLTGANLTDGTLLIGSATYFNHLPP